MSAVPAELLEPVYCRDERDVTTYGFRLAAFKRERAGGRRGHADAASLPFSFGPLWWCVDVHTRGTGRCRGTHLSAFVRLMTPLTQGMSVTVPFSMTVLRTDGGDPGLHVVRGSPQVDAFAGAHQFHAGESPCVGWPDLLPLHSADSFLDDAGGLLIHASFGKPAVLRFAQTIRRSVLSEPEVFDTVPFRLVDHTWMMRLATLVPDADDDCVSAYLMLDSEGVDAEGDGGGSPGGPAVEQDSRVQLLMDGGWSLSVGGVTRALGDTVMAPRTGRGFAHFADMDKVSAALLRGMLTAATSLHDVRQSVKVR